MALKLLILGLPGSGKSTIARHITAYLNARHWGGIHFSDHVILREMFLADSEHKHFKPADHDGFDVIDFTVFEIALQRLEQEINQYLLDAKQDEMVLVEFARNDYQWAFQQFSATFLHDAYFLCLCIETDICKERILKRVANPNTEDDFYVSEHIFSTYYSGDDARSVEQVLVGMYGIDRHRVKVIDNNGSLPGPIAQVYQFVDSMCGYESLRDS